MKFQRLCTALLMLPLTVISSGIHALEENETLPAETSAVLELNPDKVTVIDFFASWCVSCRVELPQISAMIPGLDPSQVEVIGINVDEEQEEGQAYIDSFKDQGGLNFRVVMDPEQKLIETFEPLGMPALYFIRNGVIEKMHLGAMPNIDKVILADLKAMGYR